LTTASGQSAAGAGGDGNQSLAQQRAALMSEIERDPALRNRIHQILDGESHGDQTGAQGVMETMVNRAMRLGKKSLWEVINTNFYGPQNRGELRKVSDSMAKIGNEAISRVAGGSNITDFRDDQGTNRFGQPEMPKGGSGVVKIGNELFYYSGEANRQWAEKMRRSVAGAPTTAPPDPSQASKVSILKTRATEPGQAPTLPPELTSPTRMAPPSAQTAAGGRGAGNIIEAQNKEAGVRKGAISADLKQAFQYASAQTGLTVRVTSGGQRMAGATGATGSHRHDSGDAADFDLIDKDGNKVPHADPRALEFVYHATRAGVKGGGAADSYMGQYKIHLDVVGAARGGGPGIYTGSRQLKESFARGERERLSKEQVAAAIKEQQTKLAGPSPTGDTGPKIETLRTRPVEPQIDISGAGSADEGGEVASGKRGAPWFGGVAAGKGRGAGGTGFIDRSVMDGVQGRSVFHRIRGKGTVDVTINKSEDSRSTPIAGPFKKIRMHGQRQHEPAASGPPEATAANHDPGLDS